MHVCVSAFHKGRDKVLSFKRSPIFRPKRLSLFDWRIFLSLFLSLFPLTEASDMKMRMHTTSEQPGVVTTARNLMRIGSIPYVYIPVRARTRAPRFINKMNTPTFGVASPSKIEIRARRAKEGERKGEREYLLAYILNIILYEDQ